MNRRSDFDDQLRSWADLGDEHLPTRYLEAAFAQIETTPQRGAIWWPLEGLLMTLKPAAPILGVAAAVVVLAIAGYQLIGGRGNFGGPTSPTPTQSPWPFSTANTPTQSPWPFSTANLPYAVPTDGSFFVPDGMTADATTTGYQALTTPLRPGGAIMPLTGFVDALMTKLNSTEAGAFVSWAALYETTAEAEAAFDFLVTEHESADGWGLDRSATTPQLGDEVVLYAGAAYAFDDATIYLWRANNMLLAAVAVGDVAIGDANAELLRTIAEGMDSRARKPIR